MKSLTLGLTLLLCSVSLYALELARVPKIETLGEERVIVDIVASTPLHTFDGCEEPGFHVSAEETSEGIYTFSMYCGEAPEDTTEYTIIRDTGI